MKMHDSVKIIVKKMIFAHNFLCPDKSICGYIRNKSTDMRSGKFLYKGRRYAENSILNWEKLSNLWEEFEKYLGKKYMTFDDMTFEIYFEFLSFCDGKGYSESTKCLYASILKSAMNYACEDKISSNHIQREKKFATHKVANTSNIFLTAKEIEKIANLDLSGAPELDKVRDLFLAGCYTGQRFSDYSQISTSNIVTLASRNRNYRAFKIKQRKTCKTVVIPIIINENVLKILSKRDGKLPAVPMRRMNVLIKKVCKLAGIDNKVALVRNKGGKMVRVVAPKYEFVSSHTARRSCITNFYLSGRLSLGQIRSISGHSSEESLNRYLCQSKEEQAIEVIRALSSKSGRAFQR